MTKDGDDEVLLEILKRIRRLEKMAHKTKRYEPCPECYCLILTEHYDFHLEQQHQMTKPPVPKPPSKPTGRPGQ